MVSNTNRITDDHSNWRTSSRVVDYLNRINKIPHRTEGEFLLCEFIPKKTSRILDLGTGNGRLIKLLKEKIPAIESVAIDFSPPMLNELRMEFLNDKTVEIIEHDLTFPLPTNLGKFDAIISSFAIHHLKHNRKKDLYSEIFFILKPGGIFCNLDHIHSESKKLNQYFKKVMGLTPVNREHGKRLTKINIQLEWLLEIGFTDVDCYWRWLEFALLIGFKPWN
jgi:tRNA (cmo5U34)-methyltransferase